MSADTLCHSPSFAMDSRHVSDRYIRRNGQFYLKRWKIPSLSGNLKNVHEDNSSKKEFGFLGKTTFNL